MLAALLTNLPAAALPPVIPEPEPEKGKGGGWVRPKKARKLRLKIDPEEKTELFEGTEEKSMLPLLDAMTALLRAGSPSMPKIEPPRPRRPEPASIKRVLLAQALSPRLSVDSRVKAVRKLRNTGRISEDDEEEALMIILMSL